MVSTLVCPDPRHDPAAVELLEEIAAKAEVAYTRLEGRGVGTEVLADLGRALQDWAAWAGTGTDHPRRVESEPPRP